MLAGELLDSYYNDEPQLGLDGELHPIDGVTRIAQEQSDFLYEAWMDVRPDASLEIGLAYGFSTAAILSARHAIGHGHHTAIDPFQRSAWNGIGACVASRLGMEAHFSWVEELSDVAIPEMIKGGREYQFIFIDGNHTFDAALVDFSLSARVLSKEGVILFDDLWMPAIRSVVDFVERNRIDFVRVPSPLRNVAVFRKTQHPDPRSWDHFEPFESSSKRDDRSPSVKSRRWLRSLFAGSRSK